MRDIKIIIRMHNIFYAIVVLLVMYAIDKKLLVLPSFALALAVIIVPTFAASVDVERILDFSAFSIDWSTDRIMGDRVGNPAVTSTLASPEDLDQKIPTTTTHDDKGESCQKVLGIFVPIMPAQDEGIRLWQYLCKDS
jgi:hypothetical protein